jgi:hypothetical protein
MEKSMIRSSPMMREPNLKTKFPRCANNFSLVLLSIQFMLQMAVEEIYTLCEELLQHLRSREKYSYHARKADEAAMWHKDLIQSLKQELQGMPLSVMRLLLCAAQDIACIQSTANNDELLEQNTLIDAYEAKRHFGIACALQMARIHKGTDLLHETAEDERFRQSRTGLLEEWGSVFRKYQFDNSDGYTQLKKRGLDLLQTQLFIPRAALRLPKTLDNLRWDGRVDLIGRSVYFMEYDARITERSPLLCFTDHDCSGRNVQHMICLRKDHMLLTRLIILSASAYGLPESGVWLGLTPLEIATCKGNTRIADWLKAYAQLKERDKRNKTLDVQLVPTVHSENLEFVATTDL